MLLPLPSKSIFLGYSSPQNQLKALKKLSKLLNVATRTHMIRPLLPPLSFLTDFQFLTCSSMPQLPAPLTSEPLVWIPTSSFHQIDSYLFSRQWPTFLIFPNWFRCASCLLPLCWHGSHHYSIDICSFVSILHQTLTFHMGGAVNLTYHLWHRLVVIAQILYR